MAKKIKLPIPQEEQKRLESVLDYDILNTHYEQDLDNLTKFTANLYKVPIVLITILDENRQWFKSNYGLDIKETERSISFCQYTIMENDIFEIENAYEDERFSTNPLVTHSPKIRFYAGAPLINEKGFAIGSLALIDRKPRKLSEDEKLNLKLLSKQVINFFELSMKKKELEKEKKLLKKRVQERTKEIAKKVAELEQRDKKLQSLNNELSRFIYKLSHDLLGPIKSLQGLTSLAIEQVKDSEIKNYLNLIKKTEDKLDRTLISLIKLLSVKDPWEIENINWESLISDSINKARQRLPEAKISFNTNLSTEQDFISDPVLLEIMIEEFLVNSMQYNYSSAPSIQITIQDVKEHILIEISDNGIGIREEEKDKIFEMFYKNEKSLGSGLGLFIVKNIVEKMGGSIRVQSIKNSGTKFQLLIPIKQQNQ